MIFMAGKKRWGWKSRPGVSGQEKKTLSINLRSKFIDMQQEPFENVLQNDVLKN